MGRPAPEPPASEAPTDPGLPVTDPDTCPHGGPAADCWPHSNTCLFESTDPGIGLGPCDPSPEWLEAVAVDREIVSFLALADKVLRESAAERAAREQDDIRDRGQAALVKYAGAMTAAAERQGGQK